MPTDFFLRTVKLSMIFIKEQLKEPSAFFWTLISPAAAFYAFNYSRGQKPPYSTNYIEATSWFYAYIASTVALFGLSFYIIGRRESGFIRSFIYTRESRAVFLSAKLLAYSLISIFYCWAFYAFTRGAYSSPNLQELFHLTAKFYICFLFFSTPALLLTLLPITFQTANTVFSILSFSMLIAGIYSAAEARLFESFTHLVNPLKFAYEIMASEKLNNYKKTIPIATSLLFTHLLLIHKLRTNPIWSRY